MFIREYYSSTMTALRSVKKEIDDAEKGIRWFFAQVM